MNRYDLKGKVALVTGASQGIGAATAKVFAANGADVILCARRVDKLEKVAEEIRAYGVKALTVELDVTNLDSINAAVEKGVSELGHIDVLVNSAGIWRPSTLVDMDPVMWDDINATNLKGSTFMAKAVARKMIEQGTHGTILFLSSQAGLYGQYANSAYGSSKVALHSLTQVMALELSQHNINTVAICPGSVYTEMLQGVFNEQAAKSGITPEERKENACQSIPQGRLCEPSEVGELMAFLASDAAAFITGVTITIAGGETII